MAIFKLQKNSVGAKGEKEAQKYLKKQGYKIIDRNWYYLISVVDK
jgi:Holliday junction resolvase-like predicted endonuclease